MPDGQLNRLRHYEKQLKAHQHWQQELQTDQAAGVLSGVQSVPTGRSLLFLFGASTGYSNYICKEICTARLGATLIVPNFWGSFMNIQLPQSTTAATARACKGSATLLHCCPEHNSCGGKTDVLQEILQILECVANTGANTGALQHCN